MLYKGGNVGEEVGKTILQKIILQYNNAVKHVIRTTAHEIMTWKLKI